MLPFTSRFVPTSGLHSPVCSPIIYHLQSMVNMHGAKLIWWMSELLWLYDHQFIKTTLRSLVVLLKKKNKSTKYRITSIINLLTIESIECVYNIYIPYYIHNNVVWYYIWIYMVTIFGQSLSNEGIPAPQCLLPNTAAMLSTIAPSTRPTLPPGRPLMTWARSIFASHYLCTWIWTVFCFQHIQRFIC